MSAIITIPLADISVGARMRRPREDIIVELAKSIREIGLLHPISVTRDGKRFTLVAGANRLQAFHRLKIYDRIPAILLTAKDDLDHALLAEIDENLIRADLSPAERALHVDARKTLYEKLHPETKHGAIGRGRKKTSHNETSNDDPAGDPAEAFIDDTAKQTGKSRATVARDAKRGRESRERGDWLMDVAGTPLDIGEELDALARLPPDERTALIARAKNGENVSAKTRLKQLKRSDREQELATKITALPDKKFGVILADPEWRFEPWSRETGMDRAADNHYPTSCTEVIAARDVPSIAAKDCALFLCATAPMLPHAMLVMAAWGFDYVTNWELHKDRVITGYWNRNRHEHLLLGTRGNVPCPAPGEQWDSVIEMEVGGRHSAKPEAICEMIEAYFPNLPKIELNRRGPARPGWQAWGNEAVTEAAE